MTNNLEHETKVFFLCESITQDILNLNYYCIIFRGNYHCIYCLMVTLT